MLEKQYLPFITKENLEWVCNVTLGSSSSRMGGSTHRGIQDSSNKMTSWKLVNSRR